MAQWAMLDISCHYSIRGNGMVNLYEFLGLSLNAGSTAIKDAIEQAEAEGKDEKLILACKNILLNNDRRLRYIKSIDTSASKTNLKIGLGIAVAIVVLAAIALFSSSRKDLTSYNAVVAEQAQTNEAALPAISYRNFERITPNHTRIEEVQELLGNGKILSDSGDFKMYSWVNSDGSNISVMTENGVVINKAQFGLK